MQGNPILYLSRSDVETLCESLDAVELVRNAFILHARGETNLPDEAYLSWQNGLGQSVRSLNMPGYLGGEVNAAGTKIINANPHNVELNLPRADGLTLLFNPTTAQIECVMDGSYISSLRTACVSALAANQLCSTEPHSVSIIGAGVQARAHLQVLTHTFPSLRQVFAFDINSERLETLSREVSGRVSITKVPSAVEAVRSSTLVITLTTVTTGYIQSDWLLPGTVLINVSLDDIVPEVVFAVDRIVVDDWNLVQADSRRILGRLHGIGKVVGPKDKDVYGARRVDAELGELLLRECSVRTSASDKILVNPFGMSLHDIAIASKVFELAGLRPNFGYYLPR